MSIKKLRTAKNMTQTALAEGMNVSQAIVSMWETGASMPSGFMLIKLSKFFGCTIDELLDGGDAAEEAAPAAERAG
jgi:transcriptional regulator with XRE-family HTH domain